MFLCLRVWKFAARGGREGTQTSHGLARSAGGVNGNGVLRWQAVMFSASWTH